MVDLITACTLVLPVHQVSAKAMPSVLHKDSAHEREGGIGGGFEGNTVDDEAMVN